MVFCNVHTMHVHSQEGSSGSIWPPTLWQIVKSHTDYTVNSSSSSSSSSSRNEYYLGGIITLLLQDRRTMSTESVCSSQYMVTDQHWATGAQIKHSTLTRTPGRYIVTKRPTEYSCKYKTSLSQQKSFGSGTLSLWFPTCSWSNATERFVFPDPSTVRTLSSTGLASSGPDICTHR